MHDVSHNFKSHSLKIIIFLFIAAPRSGVELSQPDHHAYYWPRRVRAICLLSVILQGRKYFIQMMAEGDSAPDNKAIDN